MFGCEGLKLPCAFSLLVEPLVATSTIEIKKKQPTPLD